MTKEQEPAEVSQDPLDETAELVEDILVPLLRGRVITAARAAIRHGIKTLKKRMQH